MLKMATAPKYSGKIIAIIMLRVVANANGNIDTKIYLFALNSVLLQ